MDKFFYLHIPKTAGSFFNKFLSYQFDSFIDHIEVKRNIHNPEDIQALEKLGCFSGHILYPIIKNKFKIENRKTITLLRHPIEQVVSHITFVRELAEESEQERFKNHAKTIQEIAKKLQQTELSNPKEIEKLISWLEQNNIWLFHDCQTKYLGGGAGLIQPANLNNALINLEKIDYVGITERLKEFMILLAIKENFKLIEPIKENVTKSRYGLDINNIELRKVLQPLIQNDHIVYRVAREQFMKNLHNLMIEYELQKGPRCSSVRVEMVFNEIKKRQR